MPPKNSIKPSKNKIYENSIDSINSIDPIDSINIIDSMNTLHIYTPSENNIDTGLDTGITIKKQSNNTIINNNDVATIDEIINKNLFEFDQQQKSIYYMFHKALLALMKNMSKTNHTIPDEHLNTYYLKIIPSVIKQFSNAKRKNRKNARTGPRCMARKTDGTQCTRQPSGKFQYCKSHQKSLPCGRIDEDVICVPVVQKRGRKRKFKYDPRMCDNDYATLWEDIVDGDRVLVDADGNVFSYDENSPIYLGKKTLEGKIDSKWVKLA